MAAAKVKIVATPRKSKQEETPPATTPSESYAAFGGVDHSFTLQAIMDLKGSMGELKSSVDQLRTSIEGMKSKVDDLVTWKHKIIGGAVVLGVVISVCAFLVGKFSDYVTIKSPSSQTQPSIIPTPSSGIQVPSPKPVKPQ